MKNCVLCLSSSPKVHIQTIGILVSEKSELQTALQYTQQAARQKTGEPVCFFIFDRTCTTEWPNVCSAVLTICVCLPLRVAEAEELNNRLQATKQRVSELERTLSSVSTQQKQFEKVTEIALISRCQPNSLAHD